jgi:hypothetical protein
MGHQERREQEAQHVYNRRIAAIVKEFGPAPTIKTAGNPLQGPWYFVFLKPNWVLQTMPMSGDEQTMDHPDFWKVIVTQNIAPHYKIKKQSIIADLQNLPYAMPRGRITSIQTFGGRKQWAAYHGNDYQYSTADKKKIASEFNLTEQLYAGLLRFIPDDHEHAISHDFQRFISLVNLKAQAIPQFKVQEPAMDFDE